VGRLLEKEFGLFLIPLADRLIGRDAPDAAVSAIKVVSDEPAAQVVFHLLRVLITVCFGGVLLDQAVGSFDHPVGFGGVRLGLAVFDFLLPTELLKGMNGFGLCPPAILETVEGELAPVVGKNLLDLEGIKLQAAF